MKVSKIKLIAYIASMLLGFCTMGIKSTLIATLFACVCFLLISVSVGVIL